MSHKEPNPALIQEFKNNPKLLAFKIRQKVERGLPIMDHYWALITLTGVDHAWQCWPYTPEECFGHPARFMRNAKVSQAVFDAQRQIKARLNIPMSDPILKAGNTHGLGDGTRSKIVMDDVRVDRLTADYSGGAIQGKYSGSKYKNKGARKANQGRSVV